MLLHGCGFPCPVVSEKGGDLSLIELQCQAIHSQLLPMAVDLDQVLDVNTWINLSWLLLNTHCCG